MRLFDCSDLKGGVQKPYVYITFNTLTVKNTKKIHVTNIQITKKVFNKFCNMGVETIIVYHFT